MQKKIIIIIALLLMLIPTVSAEVTVKYSISPSILLPGDYADCTLTITNVQARDIFIYSVSVYGNGLYVSPSQFSVGVIPPGGSYILPFSIKAVKPGRYNVQVQINTANGTLIQNILVVVDNNFPTITVTGPVYVGEVNNLRFIISTPVQLSDVRVEPLFNATPKVVYLGNVVGTATGVVKFLAKNKEPLKFRISFYNGKNYHQITREVTPVYINSKGVMVNVSIPYSSTYIGDCVPIVLQISNLRQDTIYNVTVVGISKLGSFTNSVKKIPTIPSGNIRIVKFMYTPVKSGLDELKFKVIYYDEFGDKYVQNAELRFNVTKALAVSLTNINIAKSEFGGIEVSGDVSNNGRTEVYNAYVIAKCGKTTKEYFIGNIDPSDFQSFDLNLKSCSGNITLIVQWSNIAGKQFELFRTIETKVFPKIKTKSDNTPLIIAGVFAAIIVCIVAYVAYRQIRK